MNQLPVRMPFCRAEVCGADEAVKLGKPTTLSEYIVALVGANPSGVFVEIGFDGIERSRTYGELFEEARKLAGKIKKFWSGGDQIALLCFETVAEYIPAAWACLLNGFSFSPALSFPTLTQQGCILSAGPAGDGNPGQAAHTRRGPNSRNSLSEWACMYMFSTRDRCWRCPLTLRIVTQPPQGRATF